MYTWKQRLHQTWNSMLGRGQWIVKDDAGRWSPPFIFKDTAMELSSCYRTRVIKWVPDAWKDDEIISEDFTWE